MELVEDLRTIKMLSLCIEKLGTHPCPWQLDVYKAVGQQTKDLVVIAGTGAGKTLAFTLAMLDYEAQDEPGLFILISPLTELQKEQVSL